MTDRESRHKELVEIMQAVSLQYDPSVTDDIINKFARRIIQEDEEKQANSGKCIYCNISVALGGANVAGYETCAACDAKDAIDR